MAAPSLTAGIPPTLGLTPTALAQILWPPARVPNVFTAALESGDKALGQVVGAALLALPLIIDYTMGNFTLPIPFPPQSFIHSVQILGMVAFTATTAPTVQLGETPGGAEILAATGLPKTVHAVTNAPVLASLPFPSDSSPMVPWQTSLTVAGNGAGANTAGIALVTILYGRF